MTIDEWNSLRPGMFVIDKSRRGARRKVLDVKRHRAKNSALTRTSLTTSSLKSVNGTTIIFETENTGPFRFDMAPKDPA